MKRKKEEKKLPYYDKCFKVVNCGHNPYYYIIISDQNKWLGQIKKVNKGHNKKYVAQ